MVDCDLFVIGDCNPDLVLDGDVVPVFGQVEKVIEEAALTIGGSGAIVACGATRLGMDVALAGLVGDDAFGRLQLDALRARSVNVDSVVVDPQQRTGLSVIFRREGDRAILTLLGAIGELKIDDIDQVTLAGARHLHISSYFLQTSLRPDVPKLLELAHAAGAKTSLDTNWDPEEQWSIGADGVLADVDCFLPNAEEARRISGCETAEEALAALAAEVATVVIKLGPGGAIARSGSESAHHGALDVDVVDTVGAGDSFDAGFLTGRLRGFSLERSLALACACGSLSTRATGGVNAQPSMAEATSLAGISTG